MKKKLLNGEKIIYIATRLFNISDKMAGNTLEQKVYAILKNCVNDEGNKLEIYPLYLPFRDTNEDQQLGCENAFQIIYDADIRPCLKIGGMPNGERFFRQSRQIFAGGLTPGKKI